LLLQASPGSKKIVGVFYKGGEYAAQNPNFVGCVENALGIRSWLESQGHQYIVTHDKDGPNCGNSPLHHLQITSPPSHRTVRFTHRIVLLFRERAIAL
jgi:formate dehydrogenase